MTVKMLLMTCAAVFLLHAQDTIQPIPVTKIPPAYPESAKRLRVEARVLLTVLVGTNGAVMESELLQAAVKYPGGSALVRTKEELMTVPASHRNTARKLIDISQSTVKQWKFNPAMVKKEPVEAMIVVPFTYRLNNNPAPPQQKLQFKR